MKNGIYIGIYAVKDGKSYELKHVSAEYFLMELSSGLIDKVKEIITVGIPSKEGESDG